MVRVAARELDGLTVVLATHGPSTASGSAHGAAMESNHPTGGLLRPAGFEDRMGHQTPAAPGPMLERQGTWVWLNKGERKREGGTADDGQRQGTGGGSCN